MTSDTDTSAFQTRLDTIRNEIDQIQTQVTDDATQATATLSSQLQDALRTLAQLASVIRGDFDHRPPDVGPKPETDLLKTLTSQCGAVHDLAVKALAKVGDDHAKVSYLLTRRRQPTRSVILISVTVPVGR